MANLGYRKSCDGKQRHKTIGKAQAHIRSLQKRGLDREGLHVYFCPFCKHHHIGRQPKPNHVAA